MGKRSLAKQQEKIQILKDNWPNLLKLLHEHRYRPATPNMMRSYLRYMVKYTPHKKSDTEKKEELTKAEECLASGNELRKLYKYSYLRTRGLNKKQKALKKPASHSVVNFYESREWRALRYQVLKKYAAKCMCCGRLAPDVQLHVDHIKPRSLHPSLELDMDNLQILCKDCNLGKSNTDCKDWR